MILQTLNTHLQEVIKELYGKDIDVSFSEPKDISHGDYASSVALALSKELSRAPLDVAEDIAKSFSQKADSVVSSVTVAVPGFINITLKPDVVRECASSFGEVRTKFSDKKVLVEHSSLNLFKPFTIGHLVNNIVGQFVSQAVNTGGAQLVTMTFPSDVSLGVAKAIFIIKEDGGIFNALIPNSENIIEYLGEAYRRGVVRYEEDESVRLEIRKISDDIYTFQSGPVLDIYEFAKKENVNYFLAVLSRLGSHFDDIVYESEAGIRGSAIVKEYTGVDGVFQESDGAIVYVPDESRKDINTAVFINREGHPTYEAKDIGLIDIKFFKHNPDLSIFITDAEQIPHFRVVLDAYNKIEEKQKEKHGKLVWSASGKSLHVPHGRMTFKGQKMSSRLGGVPLALDVIEAVEEEVRERASEKLANYSQEEKDKITRAVALSAIRIAILRSKPGININFDPETSLSFEGDSGPYLLYTHARCASLLEKGKENGYTPLFSDKVELSLLERTLLHYDETLQTVVNELAPQKMVTYLFTLAQACNSYYANNQIISDNKEESEHRLAVMKWTKEVLAHGLSVLGVEAVERM